MNTSINNIIEKAASYQYTDAENTEAHKLDRYDDAIKSIIRTATLPMPVGVAIDTLNALINAIWIQEPLQVVTDGDGVRPDALECVDWRHGYAEGHTRQRAETFGQDLLNDLLTLIGKEASISYDEGSWTIANIFNL